MNIKYVYKIEVSLLHIIIEEVILIAFLHERQKSYYEVEVCAVILSR